MAYISEYLTNRLLDALDQRSILQSFLILYIRCIAFPIRLHVHAAKLISKSLHGTLWVAKVSSGGQRRSWSDWCVGWSEASLGTHAVVGNAVSRLILSLTHLFLAFHKRDIGRQCRPRSDAAEVSVWSRSTLFASRTGISVKHGYNTNWPDIPYVEINRILLEGDFRSWLYGTPL